ncbi:unnamed protein product [Darwinula stevensoni]|uniref:Survival of motor neuron-related-splicing factor 30 n=1 Tax=Darwinula stevensoni TaxID=69355 RepID=A0A7R9A6V2_9CRUS|nr:unnamed protein product [Darwinula stevensoni]CAG0889073.1 unnamed protein product [Darwinula stevensoni]
MDDLRGNLVTYKLQLKQVIAALQEDPQSEELNKLKSDLEEVIALTKDLVKAQSGELVLDDSAKKKETENNEAGTAAGVTEEDDDEEIPLEPIKDWKVGDRCRAIWSQDGQYYEAIIDEITEDGQCMVKFMDYGNMEVLSLVLLKESKAPGKRVFADETSKVQGPQHPNKIISQKKQREYLKQKKMKKLQKYKELEQEREAEKHKWQSFASKVKTGHKRGVIKKSIFASPETVQGRVGVGTCGVSGKGMTNFHHAEKWRKGM